MKEVFVGTSGWNYKHWKEIFYPKGLAQRKWLEFYCENFSTVEVNATFYRRLKEQTFKRWYEITPKDFLFTIKANRFITHIKKLVDIDEPLANLYKDVAPLKGKLGAILFQLPPSLKYDFKIIKEFLTKLDPNIKTTIEIRNKSFLTDEFFNLLKEFNIAFCISDTAGRYPLEIKITADFFYIRLHGSKILYRSRYSIDELNNWADHIKGFGRGGFVFFDNDFDGNAVINAKELINILKEKGVSVS